MKQKLIIIFLLVSVITSAQQAKITATVKDSQTGEVLPYCNISIRSTGQGTITNADGIFSIIVKSENDELEFSYLGYETQKITAKSIAKSRNVMLEKQNFTLQEITISGNQDFLYSILSKCSRNVKKNNNKIVSKVYFGLESEVGGKPVEFLECYFNAELKGHRILDLILKNGRIAHNIIDNSILSNLETTKAIRLINLIEDNGYYPSMPMQLNKKQMSNMFRLYLMPSDSSLFHIGFSPRNKEKKSFSGEIWIDRQMMLPRKISLEISNAGVFPFHSVVGDIIDSVNLNITLSYNIIDGSLHPELITFDYRYCFQRGTGAELLQGSLEEFRTYNTKSVLYFYDPNNPFISPYFNYDTDISDYHKLELIPYNSKFWEQNKALQLTKNQKRKINFIASDEYQFFNKESHYGKSFMLDERAFILKDTAGYSSCYTFWYPDKRVFINKVMPNNKTATPQEMAKLSPSSLIKLKAQILLDVIEVEDSLVCSSYTIFEDVNSYYRMPIDSFYSHALVNIFFDICEIERRKMQSAFDTVNFSLQQIEDLYEKTNYEISMRTTEYINDVALGKNYEEMQIWNDYIIDNLGIDNISMLSDYYKKRYIRNDSIIENGGEIPTNIFE